MLLSNAFLSIALALQPGGILRSAKELSDFHEHKYDTNLAFEVDADIMNCSSGSYIIRDKTARAWVNTIEPPPPPVGSRARLGGIARYDLKQSEAMVVVTSAVIIGTAERHPPLAVEIGKINDRQLNFCDITTSGTVIDVHDDEIDKSHTILLLKDGAAFLPVSFERQAIPSERSIVGARISVTGIFHRALRGLRKYSGPLLTAQTFTFLSQPPADPFDAPALKNLWYDMTPNEIAALDRHAVRGTVLASWGGNRLVVRDAEGRKVNVLLSAEEHLPPIGRLIDVIGHPQTDLYRICLAYARWRQVNASAPTADAPEKAFDINTDEALPEIASGRRMETGYHGELVRLRGIVRSLPADTSPEKRLYLASGSLLIPIDCTTCPEIIRQIELGAEIEVTGRCIVETSEWSPQNVFPSARGFFVVARSTADFRVLRNPAWWTPARFVLTLLVLLGAFVVIFLWNLSLQVLVKRRARQLFKADLARATSDLRVKDRTRLSVELHDSLSQILTGVSMEVEAAIRHGAANPATQTRHLEVADKLLKSCRNELRNSLWDLRNEALEEHDLGKAIQRTLLPHVRDIALKIRFRVPRARLTDNTTHEILRIIRELAVNGISHGGATSISVAGSIQDNLLMFSVRDNGTGFDPDTAPGVLQGHYGLEGIRERLRSLKGRLSFESVPVRGTKATITIPLPSETK